MQTGADLGQQQEKAVSKEDLEAYLRRRAQELEEELRMIKTILEYLDDTAKQSPLERAEDVKVGRRRIAKLLRGEDYVRVVPELPLALPRELREYLETVEGELKAYQAKEGAEGEGAKLTIRERPDGTVAEIRFDGVYSTLEMLKAKAALKYAMEMSYEVYRAQSKGGEEQASEEEQEAGPEEAQDRAQDQDE